MASPLSKIIPFQTQFAALLLINFMLLIPLIIFRAVAIISLGVLIYIHERQLKMLVPASPGFVFWLSNIFSYIIGGVGLTVLSYGSEDICKSVSCEEIIGLFYLNDGLLYIGVGLSCYIVGMWLAGRLQKPNTPNNIFLDLNFSQFSIISISVIFYISAMAGGDEETATDYGHSLYYNLIIGSIGSIQVLPIILLSIYLLQKNRNWLLVGMLFSTRFVVAIYGMLIGYGRSQIMITILALVLAWLALHFWYRKKIPNDVKIFLISLPFLIVVYFGFATSYSNSYRNTFGVDTSTSISEKRNILSQSTNSTISSDNFITDTLTTFCIRLNQGHGLELFGMAESGLVEYSGWTMNDLEQALFVYIPKTWYPNKGVGLGRDIMVEYGFTVNNNIPPTLLGDSFRRSGLFGVIIVYFIMGFVATAFTIYLNNHWGSFGSLLALYLALSSLNLISFDVMSIYNFYVYRIITSGIVIYVLLRMTGFLPKYTLNKAYRISSNIY